MPHFPMISRKKNVPGYIFHNRIAIFFVRKVTEHIISLRGRLRNKVNVIRKRTRLKTHKIYPFSNTFNSKH